MFIGHLPAGYLLGKSAGLTGGALAACLVGSIVPDLDMLWFYLVDDRSTHHHHYITHRPAVWIGLLCVGLALRNKMVIWFSIGAVLYCALDTIVGSVMWLWHLSDAKFNLITVAATHDHWIKSFLAHWTFKVEIGVTLAAALLLWLGHKRKG